MVLNRLKKVLFTIAFTFCFFSLSALNVPALKGRVNDYANIINPRTESELNTYLESLENSTGIQMVVLTVPSLKGDDLNSFSIRVAENWKIGQKDKDNGALLIVALEERQVRIEVGYGLEDKLTDMKCGLIIRNVIIPEFKSGDYSKGIYKGIQNMGGVATDNAELISKTVSQQTDDVDLEIIFYIIVWLVFFFLVLPRRFGRRYRRSFFPFIFFPGPPSGHSSSHNSFSGGFGGSHFSGGGGSFGGGGASGHW